MNIRNATVKDVPAIHGLISCYAELDRSVPLDGGIYENLQIFKVAEEDGKVLAAVR
jgi:N-acetylglutamate synthase-like GNAT family acetyltransferase